ncbi:choice-of-anchor L domain-containing protein [Gaetbulibacter sp. M235]|uniref:T9SS type B sorting domain-containing protein n=1 Tax=Gaetbulibacter sp. M235 TaxID=3126510 RepID=UPI00374E93E9
MYSFGQNVQVDSQTYTPQQLIEDILIDSNCITNVVVINVVGGNFGGTDQSYGYFDASGTTFPFQSGIVLSTGKLANVEGPNNTLSDDNATNWVGDNDLEYVLNENNTINATIIEFEFTAIVSQISFRYLFASEEYQINNANTCQYSDLFGFLIRNVNDSQYENIALIPNTQTPVKVTTVHPNIPGGCSAQNEAYFGSWNNSSAPINFNGQTAVLTATANTVPNETYHVKLVIADEQNYRYDSAVFLEAGSFELNTDLGDDRLLANNNPLCENETLLLNANEPGNNSYKWFKDGVELIGETSDTYTVIEDGIYSVEVTLNNSCVAYGNITVEYSEKLQTTGVFLDTCDNDTDGLTFFDLRLADQFFTLNGFPLLPVIDYYLTENDAIQNINPIDYPNSFINTTPIQVIFARLENEYGCFAVEPLTLRANYTSSNVNSFIACDYDSDGFTLFNLNELRDQIRPEVSQSSNITFYSTYQDAANNTNLLNDSYLNTTAFSQEIYVKAQEIYCELFTTINLIVNNSPKLLPNETVTYCLNRYPETITIDSGLLNGSGNNPSFEWVFNNNSISNLDSMDINETGTYTVNITFPNGCSSSRDIIVNPSNVATIHSIEIKQASSNNTVTVNVSGESDYQYALDNPIFQDDNFFSNVKPGFHTVYVYDVNGCGTVSEEISILGFPKFFTPNNDGMHDTWKPYGVNDQFNSDIDIKIFDRYGKFIKQINPLSSGWNGSFNGNLLPSDDYWYVVILSDGTKYRGHFTLKR